MTSVQNRQAASHLKITCNLCEQTVHLIEFLKCIYGIPELQRPSVLKRAIYRYEKYWLPLAADHPNKSLAAPLDIELAWHCHMLSPKKYEKDCMAIAGTVVNHTMRGAKKFCEKQKQAQRYWYAKFGEDQEPFTVDVNASHFVSFENYHSKITYNILAAVERQMVLYYQVSLPHHRDRKYLQTNLLRYKKYLYLKKKLPNEFLEPSYDIDLIWHSHQLNPRIYKEDMIRIMGYVLNHGEPVDHRTEEDRLYADKQSRETWKYFYNETKPSSGSLYRGKPTVGSLHKLSPNESYISCTKSTEIELEEIVLLSQHTDRNLVLSLSSSADYKVVDNWVSLKVPGKPRSTGVTMSWTSVGQHNIDTVRATGILMELQDEAGLGSICSNVVNVEPLIDYTAITGSNKRFKVSIPVGTVFDIRLDLNMRLATPKIGKALMILQQGKYETSIIPANMQRLLGPVAIDGLPLGIDNRCDVATHRLRNHYGSVEFTARIMHSQPLMMSGIQVYYKDKMSATGQLIGSDHLPLPSQVRKDIITLNPMQGERAILLQNNDGDWAIVTGRWKGFKPGILGDAHKASRNESPGTLLVKFFKFSTHKTTEVELKYLEKDFICSLGSAQIDLRKGILAIDSSGKEIAENIALAFSVSLLHVLCIPRPIEKECQHVRYKQTMPGSRPIITIPSTYMAFITAAGMLQKTPSNDYMRINKRNHISMMCAGGCMLEFRAGV